jgi:hypothetical protein
MRCCCRQSAACETPQAAACGGSPTCVLGLQPPAALTLQSTHSAAVLPWTPAPFLCCIHKTDIPANSCAESMQRLCTHSQHLAAGSRASSVITTGETGPNDYLQFIMSVLCVGPLNALVVATWTQFRLMLSIWCRERPLGLCSKFRYIRGWRATGCYMAAWALEPLRCRLNCQ